MVYLKFGIVPFSAASFVISTHSPFLLSIQDACIYNLDAEPVQTRTWTELANVRLHYDLFMTYSSG